MKLKCGSPPLLHPLSARVSSIKYPILAQVWILQLRVYNQCVDCGLFIRIVCQSQLVKLDIKPVKCLNLPNVLFVVCKVTNKLKLRLC